MSVLLLVSLGFANPYADRDSDVKATAALEGSAEAVTSVLSDLKNWQLLLPEDCVEEWVHGTTSSGKGARSRVSYTIGAMNRRLTVEISRVEPGRMVELDHEGNKGFVTRVLPAAGEVRLETYVNAPGWPFRRYFYEKIHPDWVSCQQRGLERLQALLPPAPVADPGPAPSQAAPLDGAAAPDAASELE